MCSQRKDRSDLNWVYAEEYVLSKLLIFVHCNPSIIKLHKYKETCNTLHAFLHVCSRCHAYMSHMTTGSTATMILWCQANMDACLAAPAVGASRPCRTRCYASRLRQALLLDAAYC